MKSSVKLKFLDRVLLFIGDVFVAVMGLGLILVALQTGGIELARKGESVVRLSAWVMILLGALLFCFALYALSLPAKYRSRKDGFVIQHTSSGELRISVKAMEGLVQKVFADQKEATLKRLEILNQRDGLIVDLGVALASNVSIPLVVAALQKQIKQHLLTASGVDVKQVRVSVDTSESAVSSSPYQVKDVPPIDWAATETAPKADGSDSEHLPQEGASAGLNKHQAGEDNKNETV